MSRSKSGARSAISGSILVLRDQRFILDTELAALYGVPTKRLNEQVQRNLKRFPPDFMFQLTRQEAEARSIRMAKFLFVYHGGGRPPSKEAQEKAMADWGKWFRAMGKAVVNGGNPVGKSWTVKSNRSIAKDGGANPVSGYTLIEAKDCGEAAQHAKGCPILAMGGSVEVAEAFDM